MTSPTEQGTKTPDISAPGQSAGRVKPLSPSKRRAQLALLRCWRLLHFHVPGLVPSPHQADREYFFCKDANDNRASRIPPEEKLRQTALWGVEIFGPGQADRLRLAFEQFGWDDVSPLNPGSWISEQHTLDSLVRLNLGVIERPGEHRFCSDRHAPLPDNVDYALGWIYQLSPSVTAVGMCFLLKESVAGTYHFEINSDRQTVHKPFKGGYRIFDVEYAKRRSVEIARVSMRETIVDWFKAHLPGLFSSAPDGSRLPTIELLTTVNQSLLNSERTTLVPDWKELATPHSREVWSSTNFEALQLCWPGFDGELQNHGIISLATDLVSPEHLADRVGACDRVYADLVNDRINGVLAFFAANAALREIIRWLRLTPSSLSANSTSRRGTVECLEQIRLFFDRSVGIPEFTAELLAMSERSHSYSHYCWDFQAETCPGKTPTQVSEALCVRTHSLASHANSLEKATREHLEQLSAILSTRENIRTQASMERVTWFALLVSLTSMIGTLVSSESTNISIDRLASYVHQKIERFILSK
jgi:hypothetical protein